MCLAAHFAALQGRCYCHLEFTGPSCSQSLVPSLWASGSQIASNWRLPVG